MMNPFKIFADLAEMIVNIQYENEEITRKEIIKKRQEKEHLKFEQQQKEYELWKKLTEEEHKNPDEFRILPYGWSPFGITI